MYRSFTDILEKIKFFFGRRVSSDYVYDKLVRENIHIYRSISISSFVFSMLMLLSRVIYEGGALSDRSLILVIASAFTAVFAMFEYRKSNCYLAMPVIQNAMRVNLDLTCFGFFLILYGITCGVIQSMDGKIPMMFLVISMWVFCMSIMPHVILFPYSIIVFVLFFILLRVFTEFDIGNFFGYLLFLISVIIVGKLRYDASVARYYNEEAEKLAQDRKTQELRTNNYILEQVALEANDFIAVVDIVKDEVELKSGSWFNSPRFKGEVPTPESLRQMPYPAFLSYIAQNYALDQKSGEKFKNIFSLESLQKELNNKTEYILAFSFFDGKNKSFVERKQFRFSWLDKKEGLIIASRMDITKDFIESNRKNQQLSDALIAAEQASKAKSQFLSRMSHDIRTPLNAIIGFSTLLVNGTGNSEKTRDEARKILVSSNHLLGLINDVLNMSKIESGAVILNMREFYLADMISIVDNIMRPQFEQKEQEFEISVMPEIQNKLFIADDNRIQQVLINILSNANKYTQRGGHIVMRVEELKKIGSKNGNISFEVNDNGIGMSEEYLKVAFEPFSRADENEIISNSSSGGTGLGLAITKNLVEMMGGNIFVRSTLGKGSTFTIILPEKYADPESGQYFPKDNGQTQAMSFNAEKSTAEKDVEIGNGAEIKDGAEIGKGEDGKGEDGKGEDGKGEDGKGEDVEKLNVLSGLNILAAEDNELNAEILIEFLALNGAKTTIGHNGKEVLEIFRKSPPGYYDLILMDVQMPVMNGYDSTKAIRAIKNDISADDDKRAEAEKIPIIAMTANAFYEDVQKSISSGMDAHVSKPLNIETLKKTIADILPGK